MQSIPSTQLYLADQANSHCPQCGQLEGLRVFLDVSARHLRHIRYLKKGQGFASPGNGNSK